jgi:phosphoribosyl 1,2-cyclic phosphate phosphodiesterase
MKLLFLGTGTSHGVPVIGCDCPVCKSSDSRDKRFRCSAYVTVGGSTNAKNNKNDDEKHILIDIGPDFRSQALEHNVRKVDVLLLTHSHADHLHGIDDLRIFSCDMFKKPDNPRNMEKYNAPPIPIYTNRATVRDIEKRFDYFFHHCKEGGGHAKVELTEVSKAFETCGITVTPIPMMHGSLETTGWLLTEAARETDGTESGVAKKSIAYLTDCSFISDDSIQKIRENCGLLEHLVIDGLRVDEHSTHFNFLQALEAADKIGAKHVWLTHLTHAHSHREIIDYIEENLYRFPNLNTGAESVLPAYDGLEIST